MQTSILRYPIMNVGCLKIEAKDLVFIDLKPGKGTFSKSLHGKMQEIKHISISEMVRDLNAREIPISGKISKLIESNFFGYDHENFKEIFSNIVILKGRATKEHNLKHIIKEGLPDDFSLVPVKVTLRVAYLATFIFSKEFLNLHNLDKVVIMSEPLEKFEQHQNDYLIEWDPSFGHRIGTALYDNHLTGDDGTGYLFFC